MSQNAHLTYQQFAEKHRDKFNAEGLSRAQRRERYVSYLASVRGTGGMYLDTERGNKGRAMGSVPAGATMRSPYVQSTTAARRGGNTTGQVASVRRLLTGDPLVRAMLDPFCLAGDQVPKIPDGMVSHTSTALFKQNVDIYSSASGRCAFFLRNTPWAAIAVSNASSDVDHTVTNDNLHFVSAFEYNAFDAAAGRAGNGLADEPLWTEDAWSIPLIPTQVLAAGENPAHTLQDQANAAALYATASAWRPVCCGYRFKYTAPVLSGSGEMAVARWPGTYNVPTQGNRSLYMQNEDQNPQTNVAGVGGPNFGTVQALPGAKVYSAVQGHTAVWCPNGLSTQRLWRPVKPLPLQTALAQGELAVSAYSITNLLVRPPPCTGDPARAKALIDMLYNLNLAVQNPGFSSYWGSGGTGPYSSLTQPYGQNAGLLYQPTPDTGGGQFNGPDVESFSMYAARDLMAAAYYTDMLEGDTALIMVGEGLPPSTLIGTIEIVSGFEYVPDTRVLQLGGGVPASAMAIKPSRQLDMHAQALAVVQAAPSSVPTSENGFGQFVDSVVRGAESVFSGVEKVGGLAMKAAPIFEALGGLLL